MIGTRNAYGRMRGTVNRTGKPRPGGGTWMTSGQVPNTTWADVFIVTNHVNKYLNPSTDQCIEIIKKHTNQDTSGALKICATGKRSENPRSFIKTSGFQQAKRNFDSVSPMNKGGAALVFNSAKLLEPYPFNEEFWGAATTYAIERSAAGAVPYWSEIVAESVKEAVLELPQTVGAALAAMDPRKLIPSLTPIAEIIKWTAIGGSAFLIYWYVLRK